jgi:peptidoglycan/LPS O-acetylase OafA/YrhL
LQYARYGSAAGVLGLWSTLYEIISKAEAMRERAKGDKTMPEGAMEKEPTGHEVRYRPDIDGLRAIAILAVVAFHAFPRALPGGFIGVDIFFVISGYLISSLILAGLAKGSFTIAGFYGRRIRRIFPALVTVLAACGLFGWWVLLPYEYAPLGKHIAGAAGFVNNVILALEAGYFDRAIRMKPLAHLWSLGVEEQFYIFWPVVLWVACRLKRGSAFAVAAVFAALSYLLNMATLTGHPVADFYLPFGRAWELMAGALLAALHGEPRPQGSGSLTAGQPLPRGRGSLLGSPDLLSIAGLLSILVGLFLLNGSQPFPGWRALFPVVGTALLIAAGSGAWLNRVVLSNRWIVGCGLISYPFYLWHWPIFSLQNYLLPGDDSRALRAGMIIVSALLAWLTWRFIERPIREAPISAARITALAACMAMAGCAGILVANGTIQPRASRYGTDQVARAVEEWDYPGASLHPFAFEGRTFYSLASQSASGQTLYLGDSQIEQFAPRIVKLAAASPGDYHSPVFATGSGCPPLPGVRRRVSHENCQGLVEAGVAYSHRPDVAAIVIGAHWSDYLYMDEACFERGSGCEDLTPDSPAVAKAAARLENMLAAWKREGKRVYLILESPSANAIDPVRIPRRRFGDFSVIGGSTAGIRVGDMTARNRALALLKPLAERAGATAIDPVAFLCPAGFCPALTPEGDAIYKDASHIRPLYVADRVQFLDETLRK